MFERFRAAYSDLRDATSTSSSGWRDSRLNGVVGYAEFVDDFSGASFDGGLYRVHDERSGPRAAALIDEAFPEFATRVVPFGYDWLGRQFALDTGRRDDGQPQVLLLEPGTGEALEIPTSLAVFHDEELIDYADAALAASSFEGWARENGGAIPLKRDECVGYRVPLFLGGQDSFENLEVSDLEVYWSICAGLRDAARQLPQGSSIDQVAWVD